MTEEIINDAMANIAQKRQEIQGTKTNVLTRPEASREDPDAKRSPTNRLIRGSLAHALTFLRDDPRVTGENRQVLYDFAREERELASNLDKLDAQYRSNTAEYDDGKGGKIHTVTLDLKELTEGEEDTRVPWVMIGGASSTDEGNAQLPMVMALQGEKVTILTYPEQMKLQKGGDGRSILESLSNKGQEDLAIFKNVAPQVGYAKTNLLGHSLGGAMVLSMASDPEFASKMGIENVVVMAPTGFEKRRFVGISKAFLDEGGKLNSDPEAKVFLDQGVVDANRPSGVGGGEGIKGQIKLGIDLVSGGKAAATKMIDGEVLARAASNIQGDLEIWTSSNDKIINADAIAGVVGEAPFTTNNVSLYSMEGGNHNSYFTEFGFNRARQEEQQARHEAQTTAIGKKVSMESVERSGAEFILKQMQVPTSEAA
jgi:hypothetical protein